MESLFIKTFLGSLPNPSAFPTDEPLNQKMEGEPLRDHWDCHKRIHTYVMSEDITMSPQNHNLEEKAFPPLGSLAPQGSNTY